MFPSHALIIVISSLTATIGIYSSACGVWLSGLLISPDPLDFAYPTLAQDSTTRLAIRATRIERRLR